MAVVKPATVTAAGQAQLLQTGDTLSGSIANLTGGTAGQLAYQSAANTTLFVGAGTAGQVLRSAGAALPVYSTATYPNTGGTAGTIMRSDGTNWVNSTATYPATGGTSGTVLRSNGTNFLNSTSTFADTYAIGTILIASAANVVTGLAAGATTTILVGGGAAAPVWTTATGTGAPVRATSPQFTANIGVGTAASATTGVEVSGSIGTATGLSGFRNLATVPATTTLQYNSYVSSPATIAASFTLPDIRGFIASDAVKGAGSTITNQYGFQCAAQTSGATNFAFFANSAAAATTWNFYAAGAAKNYFNGTVLIGSTTDDGTSKVQIVAPNATLGLRVDPGTNNISAIEMMNCRGGDNNSTFGGRYGAATRISLAATTLVGQTCGVYAFGGQWGTDTTYTVAKVLYPASICGVAEGAFTAAGAMPMGISFRTGVVGDSLVNANLTYGTERLRISSTGAATFTSTVADSLGDLRIVPVVNKTAGFTLALTDANQGFVKSNSTAQTHTIPLNSAVAFPIGTRITFANLGGTTLDLTIAKTAGVLLYNNSSTNATTIVLTPGLSKTLWKVATDTWMA